MPVRQAPRSHCLEGPPEAGGGKLITVDSTTSLVVNVQDLERASRRSPRRTPVTHDRGGQPSGVSAFHLGDFLLSRTLARKFVKGSAPSIYLEDRVGGRLGPATWTESSFALLERQKPRPFPQKSLVRDLPFLAQPDTARSQMGPQRPLVRVPCGECWLWARPLALPGGRSG